MMAADISTGVRLAYRVRIMHATMEVLAQI
jgi:hypothetical protein